jgi:hypothetical protein
MGGEWAYQRIADTTTPIPDGVGTFTSLRAPVISGGKVAFEGSGSDGQQGGYFWDGVNLVLVADLNTDIPEGDGQFTDVSSLSHDGTSIAFRGTGTNVQRGIYRWQSGSLTKIVDRDTTKPMSASTFFSPVSPNMDNGQIVFNDTGGIYRYSNGVIDVLVDQSTAVPMDSGNFNQFSSPTLSGSDFTFQARNHGAANQNQGVYASINNAIIKVADLTDMPPGGGVPFDDFNEPVIGNGKVFLEADHGGLDGLYLYDHGTLQISEVALEQNPAPEALGTYTSLRVAGFDGVKYAFFANLSGGSAAQALFSDFPNGLNAVIDASNADLDPGRTIGFLNAGSFSLDNGEVAFGVGFTDGSSALFVARGTPQLRISSISILAGNVEIMTAIPSIGGTYILERTTDPNGIWSVLATFVGTSSSVLTNDGALPAGGEAFYRVTSQ